MEAHQRPRPRRFVRALPLFMLAVVVACIQGSRPPAVPPHGTLGLKELGGADEEKGPLRVVYASPKGKLKGPSEVTILFNKPMRALEVAGKEAPFPAKIDPPIPGTWQWAGTRAASFIPAKDTGGGAFRLPKGTTFTVTIPKGTPSLDGDTLAEDFKLQFETERPHVVSTAPSASSEDLKPEDPFTLFFDQPMADLEVEKAVSITASGKPVAFKVTRPEPGNEKRFLLTPTAPMPRASRIALSVRAGLRGKEGPLPMETAQSFDFATFGPLSVREVRCTYKRADGKCDAPDGVVLALTNRVKLKDLKKAISIDPPAKLRFSSWMSDDETYNNIELAGGFLPGRAYTVTVRGPLSDEYGQPLTATFEKRVEFGDLMPIARIGVTSGVLEASARRDVTVGHVNTSDLKVGTVKLDEDAILALENDKLSFDEILKLPGFSSTNVAAGRKNVLERAHVSIDSVLGPKGKGTFALTSTYTSGRAAQTEKSVVMVTDLGVSAKVGRLGTVVLVTRLADASPVADADVKIRRRGKPGVTKKTDAQGFAVFDPKDFVPSFQDDDAVVFARTKDDFAYKAVSDNLWTDSFDPGEDTTIAMMFDDRGIYRPGETAHIKGILRDPLPTGMSTPSKGTPIEITFEGPDGEKLPAQNPTTTEYGTFSFDLKIPTAGRLGTYYLRAWRGGVTIAERGVEVAEFRAAEFKASVESDRPSYIRGDSAKWMGRGDFFYGAPMNGAKAELVVARTPTSFYPPNTDGFSTSDYAYQAELADRSMRQSVLANSKVSLDASGTATTSATLDLPGQSGPETVRCVLDVTDVSRQQVSASTSAIVHPGEHYAALSLDSTFVEAKTKLSPKFIAVKPNGDRVVGAPLKVSFIKRTWATAKQGKGATAASSISTPVDTVVSSCALVSQKAPVTCDVTPPDAGQYIVRVVTEDGRKNTVASSQSVYVAGESGGKLASFPEYDNPQIDLVTDKHTYAVGDKAKVLVKTPWKNAEALVTVERAGIYEQRRVKLTGSAPSVEVPITEAMRPNAYVSVLVLKGRTKRAPAALDKPDVGAPAFLLGQTNLAVDPESKRLKVEVKPEKTDLRPGDDAVVRVKVADVKGKGVKSEVTLYAADEGVLSLVDYSMPDPVQTFGASRPLHVATLESRSRLATLFDPLSGLGLDKGMDGGGGDGGGRGFRADFRASAYYNANVVTNDDGEAEVRFKLPDGLTTYRVMAVAATSTDRFGSGQSKVTTSRVLMTRPALPRFLRAGDTFDASVIVSSKASVPQEVDVTAKLIGVQASGETKKHVTVDPGKSVEVRFAAVASKVGSASFQFEAVAGSERDAVVVERRVQVPQLMESVALYGNTTEASAEKLGDLSEIRDDAGELTITTSSTALVGLDAGGAQLLDYPYGCTEQLTSRLVPLVARRELAKDFNLPMPPNVTEVVDKTVAEILTRQRYDGSFGFWPDSPKSSPWATTYALWGLDQAKKKGFSVPKSALERGTHYLFSTLESSDEGFREHVGPFVLYVLAEMGKPDSGRMSKLFEARASLPLYGKALLASAMAVGKSDPAAIAELVKDMESSVRVDGNIARTTENLGDEYAALLDSNARTSAMVLRALLHASPKHPLAAKLAMGLLADREGGHWRSTQEGAWALLALGDYRRAQEAEEPSFTARIFFGQTSVAEPSFRGRSIVPDVQTFPASRVVGQGGSILSFEVDGDGKLFYEARLRYAKKKLPTTSIDRGFYVEQRLRKVSADTMDAALETVPTATTTTFSGGDLVLADIVVVSAKPRRFVAIDAPLPAGFEAVDTRLATTSDRLRGYDAVSPETTEGDAAMERAEVSTDFTREVRDDRVLFFVDAMPAGVFRYRFLARATALGSFVTPPTKAEEMYAPEVFGRTAGQTITVSAP